jgi:two-component system, cell cycle sensor histidine kinase and response regulator CckA
LATILIAGDRPRDRDLLVTLLTSRGHRVLEASTAEEALALARADPGTSTIPVLFCSATFLQEALSASEARARFALEAARAVVWEADLATGRVTQLGSTNPTHPLPFERADETVEGFIESVHPEDRRGVQQTIEDAAHRAGPFVLLFRRVWPDGSVHWIESRGESVVDATGRTILVRGVAQDVTSRRELEDQLQQAQKIEGVGQLAGGLAHDFNNLLTVILSYSTLLAEQLEEKDPRRQDVDQIHKAGTRAAQLTRQLLAFSRKQILHPVVLDLNELVNGISPMLRRLLGEHIALLVQNSPGPAPIKFDPGQMELILVNLIVNARDAMPGGGKLAIDVTEIDVDEEFARSHLAVGPGRYVRLSVADSGAGMDPATVKRIFEPFFTTKPRGRGTGLGLATVFGIVKQSGGSIWVYSEPGMGTTFRIFVPAARAPSASTGTTAAPTAPHGLESVLLVEDESTVRRLVETVLKRAGYRVLIAEHPHDAMKIAGDPTAHVDLLLTDVVMPDMSGPTLSLRLQEARPGLRVLFMSGFSHEAIEHHSVLQGGAPLLQKPFTGADLTRMVREVLDAPARPFQ